MANKVLRLCRAGLVLFIASGTISISGCVTDPTQTPEVERAVIGLQPFVDQILATYAKTGRYPSSQEALFFGRQWSGYDIVRGLRHPAADPNHAFVVISPKSDPNIKWNVSYSIISGEAYLSMLDYGSPSCRWSSMYPRWGCPRAL